MNFPIAFVYISNRPGSIDLLASSFAKQTDPGYELVIVDGYPGRAERGAARQFLLECGVNLGWYGVPKLKAYPDTITGLCNAMNTGIIHTRADYVVFIHDFCLLPFNAVEVWKEAVTYHGTGAAITGMAKMVAAPEQDLEDDITVWREYDALTALQQAHEVWIPEHMEVFYLGLPMPLLEYVNGFDERADGCSTWALESMRSQVQRFHTRLVVDRKLLLIMFNHRTWKTWGKDWVYPYVSGSKEPGWEEISPNPFDLKALRADYLKTAPPL